MEFNSLITTGISLPFVHILSNYYLQKQAWIMSLVAFFATSHLTLKLFWCGEKYRSKSLTVFQWGECAIFGMRTLECYTLMILLQMLSYIYPSKITKKEKSFFVFLQVAWLACGPTQYSYYWTLVGFELIFLSLICRLGHIDKETKIKVEILGAALSIFSLNISRLELSFAFLESEILVFVLVGVKEVVSWVFFVVFLIIYTLFSLMCFIVPILVVLGVLIFTSCYVFMKAEKKIKKSRNYIYSKVRRRALQVFLYDKEGWARGLKMFLVVGLVWFIFMKAYKSRIMCFKVLSWIVLMCLGSPLAFLVSVDSPNVMKYQFLLNFSPMVFSLAIVLLASRYF